MFKKLFILNYSQNQCWSPDFWDQPKLILAAWLDKYIVLPYYGIKSARMKYHGSSDSVGKSQCLVFLVFEAEGSSVIVSRREVKRWNEWFCGKVAENCDSTGWVGIARPPLLQLGHQAQHERIVVMMMMLLVMMMMLVMHNVASGEDVAKRGLSCGRWGSATSPDASDNFASFAT